MTVVDAAECGLQVLSSRDFGSCDQARTTVPDRCCLVPGFRLSGGSFEVSDSLSAKVEMP